MRKLKNFITIPQKCIKFSMTLVANGIGILHGPARQREREKERKMRCLNVNSNLIITIWMNT